MPKKIAVGTDSFDKLIERNGYYVDKTELIYELVEEHTNEVTLFTRPRRFGKSLTMSMLDSFFDIQRAGSQTFDGVDIMQNPPDFCREWMHQYPTIFISLKDVEGLNFENAYEKLEAIISDLYKKHEHLEVEKKVDPADAEIFRHLKFKNASRVEMLNSLKTLMRMMHAVYGKPTILLLDEYDVPLAKANENHYYSEMADVIRSILSISTKSNRYLQFAVVTGCLRIPKESIFTGVNNFTSYSVLNPDFSNYFGFTQSEITRMLEYYGLTDKQDLIRTWYDGYVFGDTKLFCPWDVMSYISALLKRNDTAPALYWKNTSGNGAIQAFFEFGDEDLADHFETLVNGGSIVVAVTDSLTYEEAYSTTDNLWSILLMTGYVTIACPEEVETFLEESTRAVTLRIPNREIATIFQDTIVDHFKKTVDQSRVGELMDALWNGKEARASEILSDLLFETISYMDYHEDYYQAFLAGIFAGRGYIPQSNKEQGLGRPDVDLHDRKNRRMMVIECKKAGSKDQLDACCDKAIQQIIDREYAGDTDGFRTVLCYGIAFFKKTAKIKLGRS